jgi:hypothetical protein
MKKYIIPLLACTVLAGGIAFAAAPKDRPMHHEFDAADMQKHHAEMCSDIAARETGHMAYLEAKLSLTGAQQSAFENWKSVKLSEARDRGAKCATMKMPDMASGPDAMRHSPLEHMDREEDMLKHRLADIQAERPALTALYNSLNDTQKRAFAMEGGHGMHGGFGMHGHGGMHGDHGPMGGPGEGPDGHDGPPPPPNGE